MKRGGKNESTNTTTQTQFLLSLFLSLPLSFSGNSTQICGNPQLEFMLWKQAMRRNRGDYGSLFRCGIIMMIKSQLQSYSKQWYAHSWGDSQSAGFPGSLFTLSHFWRRRCVGHFASQQRWATSASAGNDEGKLDKFNEDIIAGNPKHKFKSKKK